MHATNTTLIKFPVESFRKIYGEAPENQNALGNIYMSIVDIKNIPEALSEWTNINPRDAKTTTGIAKKIKETLRDEPELFLFKNRGLTLLVESVRYDNKTNLLELELSTKEIHGLLDGGHTFKVISEFLEDLSEEERQGVNSCVKIEILEGIADLETAVKVVESRNTSAQVRAQSIEELNKQYEEIKEILKNKDYANMISYKEYELDEEGTKKTIDIKEILSYIICFDIFNFDDSKHPIKAYSSKAAVVDHFKLHKSKLSKVIPLLPTILALHDEIYLDLPKTYNSSGGKFGGLTGVTEISNKLRAKEEDLPFTDSKSKYRIPSAFIFPILASFRTLLKDQGEKITWSQDPIKFYNDIKVGLVSRLGEQAKELKNPTKLGKDAATWRTCHDYVQLEALKRNL